MSAEEEGCGHVETSCSGTSSLRIEVTAKDDVSATSRLGFRVSARSGAVPASVRDAKDMRGDVLSFVVSSDVELDFEIGIQAIDEAGNVGPVTIVPVHEGDGAGCQAAQRRGAGSMAAIAIAALVVLSRRRRASGPPRG